MKKIKIILIFLILVVNYFVLSGMEITKKRLPLNIGRHSIVLPYNSSHDIDIKNNQITRLILTLHSSNYDANSYLEYAKGLLNHTPKELKQTLIIVPHFLTEEKLKNNDKDFIHWRVYPFWGSSKAVYKGENVQFSAYDACDKILEIITTSGNFPNLQNIVISGHSAGGQMVNRYAATGKFPIDNLTSRKVNLKFIVCAPSSYVYFNNKRPTNYLGITFKKPNKPPKGYDDWGYGLKKLYNYSRRNNISPKNIRNNYHKQKVLYLIGNKDNSNNHKTLSKKPSANLQGRNRLERFKMYEVYLEDTFGGKIKENHTFKIINGIGHSGKKLFNSKEAQEFILGI